MNTRDVDSSKSALAFLRGGGEAGALMRTLDWSGSPLGQPEQWPQSLRTVVNLLLNAKSPMFLAWGPELGFLYNDAYAEILGAKHPSAMGRRFYDIWSEIWSDISPLIHQALSGEATYHENLPLKIQRRGYDEQAWFTFSYSPIRDECGAVAGMFCTCTETTAQVLAEREHIAEIERLRTLFEEAPTLMCIMRGPNHVYELVNKTALDVLGYRDLLGRPIRQAIPELEGQGFFELLDQVYATGEPFVGKAMPARLQRQSGVPEEIHFFDFIFQPIRDANGSVIGIFANGCDVTEHNRAVDELKMLDRRKDEFLAMLAHELRNPLAPISTAAQLLKLKQPEQGRIRHASEIISRQVEHLTELVNDLLDVSRVTRGLITLDQEPLDVNVIITSAVEQVQPLIEKRQHKLIVEPLSSPVHVSGDRARLVQIISNILNNAAKYTLVGGEIKLSVMQCDKDVEISVQDNGIGISPEILPYVFELFMQGERAPDRAQGGLGLGLALVKRLVELHGGNVRAESEGHGHGCRFTVRLPILSAPAIASPDASASTAPEHAGALPHVLVVDDNVDAAETLLLLLQALGYSVAAEHSGHNALKRARKEKPQIVLLDIGLPDIDGYELAHQIRAMPETERAVLIAVTGYGQSKDFERSKLAGIDHHLVKPVHLPQLAALLGQIACRSSQQ